jgi:hypothetical protein
MVHVTARMPLIAQLGNDSDSRGIALLPVDIVSAVDVHGTTSGITRFPPQNIFEEWYDLSSGIAPKAH